MRRIIMMVTLAAALAAVLLMSALPSFASNPHFVSGPMYTDKGTTLTVTGVLGGLNRNQSYTIEVIATGTATVTCQNSVGNTAPGQTQDIKTSGRVSGLHSTTTGRLNFSLTTSPLPTPTAEEAGCPNSKWSATITDVKFESATTNVYEGGTLVLSVVDGIANL
jgi:hypothetical protein